MISISDMRPAYPLTGGRAQAASSRPSARWSDEAAAQGREAPAQQPAGAESAPPQRELTGPELAQLAAKYSPKRMSAAEYDSFLEELVEKGALTQHDIMHLGYKGCVCVGPQPEDGAQAWGVCYTADTRKVTGSFLGFSYDLADANGDVLAWARVMTLWKPCSASSDGVLAHAQQGVDAFETLAGILEAMQSRRAG